MSLGGQSWPLLIFLCMLKLRPWANSAHRVDLGYNPPVQEGQRVGEVKGYGVRATNCDLPLVRDFLVLSGVSGESQTQPWGCSPPDGSTGRHPLIVLACKWVIVTNLHVDHIWPPSQDKVANTLSPTRKERKCYPAETNPESASSLPPANKDKDTGP